MKKLKKRYAALRFKIDKFLRKNNINNKYSFNKILSYKNKYKNKRCFIIGTGPSLEINQLELLKNEYTFSMNSIVLSFKDTSWRPTYYFIQDGRAFKKLKDKILPLDKKDIFIGINYRYDGVKIDDKEFYKCNFYPLYMRPDEKIYKIKFSDDCYEIVWDGTTVVYSILQMAMYMGFSEIYLMGIDCDYTSGDKKNIVEYVNNTNNIITESKMLYTFSLAKQYANKKGIKIYNLNEKGNLYMYSRKNLFEVLKRGNNDVC